MPSRDARRQRYSMQRPWAAGRSARGFEVEPRFRDLGQLLVRGLLLVQVPLQHARAIVAAELLRPGDQRPVAGDLIVLNGLRRGSKRGIEHLLVRDLSSDVIGFFDDAVDSRAVD